MLRTLAFVLLPFLLVYFAVEFGWGGGDPRDPHHNRPPWQMW